MRSIVATCILALRPFAALGACGQVDPIPAEAVVDSLLAPAPATPVAPALVDTLEPASMDSIHGAAATDTVRAAAVAESTVVAPAVLLTILLEGKRTVPATKVRLTSLGYLDATMPDGHLEHFPVSKVRTVLDERGVDRTHDVVERGCPLSLGSTPPPSPSPQEAWKSFRFRGGPKEVCGSFALTEYCVLWRADRGSDVSADERTYESFDLGVAKNVGKAMALGGTLFAGGDGVRTQWGARARGRFWISRSVSFDLSPGLVLGGEEEGGSPLAGPEPILQAGLGLEDRIALVGQVFHTRRSDGGNGTTDETAWLLGARFGSQPGMVALLVAAVAGIINNASGN
jgi:hypothetical protein